MGEVFDKSVIEIAKAEKRLNFLDSCRTRPSCNTSKFGRIHTYLAIRDDDAKVFDESFIEKTFFRFQVKVVLEQTSENFVSKVM